MSRSSVILAAAALAALGLPAAGLPQPLPLPVRAVPSLADRPAYVPDEVLVRFRPGMSAESRRRMVASLGFTHLEQVAGPRQRISRIRLSPETTVEQAVEIFRAMPDVEAVQPNFLYYPLAAPNDPRYGEQWGYRNVGQAVNGTAGTAGMDMNMEAAWGIRTDCRGVVVAVIDNGVSYVHPDIAANMWMNSGEIPGNGIDDDGNGFVDDVYGYDFVDGDGDPLPDDASDHGTHVAGTIAAVGNNNINGTGVCWQARIMALRALSGGGGTVADVISAISYAVNNGARIINMSLGGPGIDSMMASAIAAARAADVLVVAAAGNDGNDNDMMPVSPCAIPEPNILCVAALDQNYGLAAFSNYGATTVDVGAPGVNILSNVASTSTAVDLSAGWTSNSGWAQVANCALVSGMPAALANPANPNRCAGSANYANNADDRIFRSFDLSLGNTVRGARLTAFVFHDLLANDVLDVNADTTGADPFDGSNDVTIAQLTGNSSGLLLWREFSLAPCVGISSCSVGFRLRSDGFGAATGAIVVGATLHRVEAGATPAAFFSGTSMAAPHVAGLAALVWAHNPGYTHAQVMEAIRSSGDPVSSLGNITTTGRAVDAAAALRYLTKPTGLSVVNVTVN